MVRKKGGVISNHWPVDFKSVKETKHVPPDRIKVVYCSDEADSNYCNDAFSVDLNICCVFDSTGIGNPVASFSTISSYHYTDGSLIGDEGTDFYQVDLAPGWELSGMSFSIQVLNGGGWVGQPAGFFQGATSATIAVPWSRRRQQRSDLLPGSLRHRSQGHRPVVAGSGEGCRERPSPAALSRLGLPLQSLRTMSISRYLRFESCIDFLKSRSVVANSFGGSIHGEERTRAVLS